jgi:hypothetical protein
MSITYLDDLHHVVRYVPWARLRKDEDMNVIGVLGQAFRLRPVDDYLSATWAEFFPGDRAVCICSAVNAIRASKIEVKTKSGFAIGNVGAIKEVCRNDPNKHRIRIIHEKEADNDAHSALRGWPKDNEPLLDLLAEDVWGEYVLNADVP